MSNTVEFILLKLISCNDRAATQHEMLCYLQQLSDYVMRSKDKLVNSSLEFFIEICLKLPKFFKAFIFHS